MNNYVKNKLKFENMNDKYYKKTNNNNHDPLLAFQSMDEYREKQKIEKMKILNK